VLLQFPLNYFYSFQYIDKMIDNFTFRLLLSNIILLLFNLLPAFPMDGGRVLRALLGFWLNFKNATRIAVRLGQLMSIGFVIAGYFYSPFLIIIGLFVFFGAEMEWRVVKRKSKQFRFSVGDALVGDYIKIPAKGNVKDALAITFGNNAEKDFLVEENGTFAGVISREKLFEKIAEGDDKVQVANIMQTDFPQITVDDSAEEALQYMQLFKTTILPVYKRGKWIGAISQNNILNIFIRHQAANN
jgi:CBS domain-containing protein